MTLFGSGMVISNHALWSHAFYMQSNPGFVYFLCAHTTQLVISLKCNCSFGRSRVRPEILHFLQAHWWYWYCWYLGSLLRQEGLSHQSWCVQCMNTASRQIILLLLLFSCCRVRLFETPWTAARQASLSLTISQSLPKFMSTESMMSSKHLILWCPFLLLPSIFPSIRVFSNEIPLCIRWPKYWSFSISSSNEYSGLISFGIDWFDLLAVPGLSSLLQHHSPFLTLSLTELWLLRRNPGVAAASSTLLPGVRACSLPPQAGQQLLKWREYHDRSHLGSVFQNWKWRQGPSWASAVLQTLGMALDMWYHIWYSTFLWGLSLAVISRWRKRKWCCERQWQSSLNLKDCKAVSNFFKCIFSHPLLWVFWIMKLV